MTNAVSLPVPLWFFLHGTTTAPQEPAIVVDAAFQMRYGLQPTINGPSRDKVVDAITHMCMLHSWPYFREFIHSHINRMGLPAILLPLFVVSPNAVQRAKGEKRHQEE